MGAVIIVFEFIILAGLCIWLLSKFASFKKTPWYALVSTWVGWLLCFSIVFLIPIDILNMDYDACIDAHNKTANNDTSPTPSPTSSPTPLPNVTLSALIYDNNTSLDECVRPITSMPDTYMEKQWAVLWWGTMLLSWLTFPLLSSFFQASHFTTWERVVRAVKENIILYIALGVVGVIALIVLWTNARHDKSKEQFLALIMSFANAYGLVLTVVLMSYGLVDIPRYLWRKANRSSTLRYYCVMAFKYKEAIEHSKADLLKTLKLVRTIEAQVNDHDPYRPYVDVILAKCPVDYEEVTADGEVEMSMGKLVSVHSQVRTDTHSVERAVCLYEQMLKKAFKTEDIIRTRTHPQPDWRIYWSFIPPRTHRFAKFVDALEYFWHVYFFTSILRIFSVFFGILSILIVWSELTLTVKSHNLSPFANMITGIPLEGLPKQLFCLIIIFYMALCAYTTLFKIKIFNFYRLVPHQMSDAGSIMFSANYLCRLAAPLAYNFLSIVISDREHTVDSSFTSVMGDMNASGLGNKFLYGFPVLIVVLCLATIFNVYSKIGAMCCIKRLRYRPEDDDLLADEGEKILVEARESKEGRGAIQLSTKETIKSSIRKEVHDLTTKKGDDDSDIPSIQEPLSSIAEDPSKPVTLYSQMANKYGIKPSSGQGDLLPSTSRFAKRNSITAETSGLSVNNNSGIKHNLSANDLASAEAGTSNSSIRGNLSNNNLSSFSKFFSASPSTTVTPPGPPTPTPSPPSLAPPSSSSSSSSRFKSNDDLLPPTSRFARQQSSIQQPAASSAILSSPSPSSSDLSSPSGASSSTKSLLGGLFNKPKFELLPNKSPNSGR